MPACRECTKFDAHTSACSVPEGTPIRKCTIAMLERELAPLRDQVVLEIGCGSWAYPGNLVLANGNRWYGVDPNLKQGVPPKIIQSPADLVPSRGKVMRAIGGRLPFADASFDVVYSTNVLEHAHEYFDPFRRCFLEVHRVLRPGGTYITDFPIHLHGHRWFVKGRIEKILSLWHERLWEVKDVEEWRKDHAPLEAYYGWRKAGIPDTKVGPGLFSTYLISVIARKHSSASMAQRSPLGYRLRLVSEFTTVWCTLLIYSWYWTCRSAIRILLHHVRILRLAKKILRG